MKKKVLSFIVVLSMLSALVLVPLPASAATYGDFTYEVTDGKATITGYTGTETNVTVPGEVDGYTVTAIGNSAFSGNNTIRKVVLPETIVSIGDFAFSCDNLANINLPNSINHIGDRAFLCSNLTYVNLPTSLTSLSDYVFEACSELAYVRIPHNITSISDDFITGHDADLIVITGCANSAAQTYAERNNLTFATLPCRDHTFRNGACFCCNVLLGDLNKDGVVNTDDYTIMIGYVNDPSTCPNLSIADVNQDGVLDIYDRLFLLEIIAGIETWPA